MKQANKKTVRDPVLRNVVQLAETINKMNKKNMAKYNNIIRNNPTFDLKLFTPSIPQYQNREDIGLAEEIMLRQIDRLMLQEEKLNMELDKLQLKEEQNERQKEIETRNNMDHFTFLRAAWKKSESVQSCEEHMEKLLHNVGSIKGHIRSMIKKQGQVYSEPSLHQLIMESPEYRKLSKQKQVLEDLNKKLSSELKQNNIESMRKEMKIMQSQLEKLRKENLELQKIKDQPSPTKSENKALIIRGTAGDYIVEIKSDSIMENKLIYSTLEKNEVIQYFENGGRRQTKHRNSDETRKLNGINFNVEDITRSKFISTKAKQ